MIRRPPLGLTPRYMHEERRILTLQTAVYRYLSAESQIPPEWITEYNELLTRRARNE